MKTTFFADVHASDMELIDLPLHELASIIARANGPRKERLLLLKCGTFGNLRTPKGSLRHNGNLLTVSGVELDCDSERTSFADAVAIMQESGVEAIVYTSPSHRPEKPRWRVLAPLSQEVPPAQRDTFMGRLNGALFGLAAAESWTWSQAFYYGAVMGNPHHKVEVIDGRQIDTMVELDDIALDRTGKLMATQAAALVAAPVAQPSKPRPIGSDSGPVSDARLEGWRRKILATLAGAPDGGKHIALRSVAISLGGVQEQYGISDGQALSWLMDALPASTVDWDLAERTAAWGLAAGRLKPFELEDRHYERRYDRHHAGSHAGNPPDPPDPDHPQEDQTSASLDIRCAGTADYGHIQPRGWLLSNQFCRGFLSSLIGGGGVGKSALRVAQLLSLATGRSLTGEFIHQRCRVLLLSFEDGEVELDRRIAAALRYHNIDQSSLTDWMWMAAPKNMKLMTLNAKGVAEPGPLDAFLREAITKHRIDLVSLDPFVKTHSVPENDNGLMDMVCDRLASIAISHDCAIDAPHHVSKGLAAAGDASRGRGASSIVDACRLVHTLNIMSAEDAQAFDLGGAERRSFVRLDSGKINIAPSSSSAVWFKLIGQPLGNETLAYPNGDCVQTVEPWRPPDTWDGLDAALLNVILGAIDAGPGENQRYSAAPSSTTRAAWRVVQRFAPDKTEKACRSVIGTWVKNGTLFSETYTDPAQRKPLEGLRVNVNLRPS